jgi:hypothetical protein
VLVAEITEIHEASERTYGASASTVSSVIAADDRIERPVDWLPTDETGKWSTEPACCNDGDSDS